MQNFGLGTHETLEIHELIGAKNTCLAKTAALYNLVSCQELKGLMQTDIQNATQEVANYKSLLSRVVQ